MHLFLISLLYTNNSSEHLFFHYSRVMAVSVCSLCRLNLLVPTPAWRLRLVPPHPLLSDRRFSEREGWAGVAHHIYGVPGEGAGVAAAPEIAWLGKERSRLLTGHSSCRWWGRAWCKAGQQQNWLVCVGREGRTVLKAEWASFRGVLISLCVFCFPAFSQFLMLVLLSCAADFLFRHYNER